ncbi:DUF4232 domain-containing protein [Streptomyces sp. DSM 44915]|uniref:DUF4232 domain-containing protein n=1 Tax=Streptomyces chisholmiae TaxID=3075540 RepID=A0ABU2JLW6_9ACTN|nr:DUF4232 domain-containing protein [Streptomyces sp. DSM 44915]MDT0265746.1 DUF4232 domain-containing protein [Streptomyces sp. DSM 44915]
MTPRTTPPALSTPRVAPRPSPTPAPARAARRRAAAGAALLAAVGLLAAGCAADEQTEPVSAEEVDARPQANAEAQTAPATEADESSPAGDQEAANAADWCATEALAAALTPLEAAAGNRYAALVLTNTTDASCRTQGWPGLELTANDGTALPTTTVRDDSQEPGQLTLAPGESAWTQLHWTVVPGEVDTADGGCGPEPAELRVIPPDTYDATPADWELGAVCGAGRIEALPLAAGDGP